MLLPGRRHTANVNSIDSQEGCFCQDLNGVLPYRRGKLDGKAFLA